ncbi:MAG: RDD family protein [Acidimicrobiaceae bacterium]|nr:RDD family protein [Acidimicrobiaceae bacterium]
MAAPTGQLPQLSKTTLSKKRQRKLLGKNGLRVGQTAIAIVMPLAIGLAALAWAEASDQYEALTNALTAALTPLGVMLVFLLGLFESLRRHGKAGGPPSDAQDERSISGFWAFLAIVAIIVHIAGGPADQQRGTGPVALALTATAMASLFAIPSIRSLLEDPVSPVTMWSRLAARAVDTLIPAALVAVLWLFWETIPCRWTDSVWFYIVSAFVPVLVYEWIGTAKGRTWGKRWQRLWVIDARAASKKKFRLPGYWQSAVRSAIIGASLAVPAGILFSAIRVDDSVSAWTYGVAYLVAATVAVSNIAHKMGQSAYDLAALTVVIRERQEPGGKRS